jgi:hypothetical protein
MNVYIICPVRNCDDATKAVLDAYVARLERNGHRVHYPPRDVVRDDDGCGFYICEAHRVAMRRADEVHVWWDPKSTGSHFDFGMAFMSHLPFRLINAPAKTPHKSYGNVLLEIAAEEWKG